ncbi:DNA polymerase III subunit delta', partial [Candidatus Omnitrophota bacterium]
MSSITIEGQKRTIDLLSRYVSTGIVPHAYLFIGPDGVGKSETAKFFTKLLNCDSAQASPCNQCLSCKKIENYNHPDINWIEKDAAGSIKIEAMRTLEKEIYFKPYEGKRRIFIIQEAHTLTEEAANCLLKTLEEPPGNNILILTTISLELIFKTIASRCQKIFFSTLRIDTLKDILKNNYHVDSTVCHYAAHFSEGRIGRAKKISQD